MLVTEFEQNLIDEAATRDLGADLGAMLRSADILCLTGPLGAGKTTLARAIIAAATGAQEAPSPTFSLVETYPSDDFTIWHFDLYRLEKAEDVWEVGLEEAFEEGVCLIEWPEKIEKYLPENSLIITLSAAGEGRKAVLKGAGDWPDRLATLASKKPGIA